MKLWLIGALVTVVAVTSAPTPAEAKRFGGGGFSGMQRKAPAPAPKPAAPAQGQQAAPASPATAGAAPAAAAGRSWMGPIAGLAAGLGIAALMSHLGLGEAFGNFLMLALLAVAAIFLVRFMMSRMSRGTAAPSPALQGAGAATAPRPAWSTAPTSERRSLEPAAATDTSPAADPIGDAAVSTGQPGAPTMASFVPASFDAEGFSRIAKMIFIRMQAANDSADLDDLRRFTTPEMFATARVDIQERGPSGQHTDVVHVDADVLDVAHDDDRQIVSVRFHGRIVEEAGAAETAFDEIWHLVKPVDDSRSWAIAGIEQRS